MGRGGCISEPSALHLEIPFMKMGGQVAARIAQSSCDVEDSAPHPSTLYAVMKRLLFPASNMITMLSIPIWFWNIPSTAVRGRRGPEHNRPVHYTLTHYLPKLSFISYRFSKPFTVHPGNELCNLPLMLQEAWNMGRLSAAS